MEGKSDGVNDIHAQTVKLAASITFKRSTTIRITIKYSSPCSYYCGVTEVQLPEN